MSEDRKSKRIHGTAHIALALSLLLLPGCATQSDLDRAVMEANRYTRSQISDSNVDILDEVDRVDRRIDTLRESILGASEIRREMHRKYWDRKLDEQQQYLDKLRKEILGD